ncbi:LamG-like jellyroll fold domain-containing protein [Alteromonas sp. KUL49]|uniref:LamG-like jellyroll fold domain-containing protein n=1 Tax=Alteromonas sp. KUL49 TaxID=2480798 RepID=UPI00102F178F|nr:LamG-like jellyroll fold domain-containing protein [Alteromonas sp. KUL49]TAP37317.1 LamG domain-containing protein [Alteromonas sp. KUL49]GEA12940.1 hypothetical protein KUL49_33150 [Alteromonas sp. KUL49]
MSRSDKFSSVREIADAVCSDIATPEQLEALEHMLHGNVEAQRFYYDYIAMHMQLSQCEGPDLELVFRRTTEELVFRPSHSEHRDTPHVMSVDAAPSRKKSHWLIVPIVIAVVMLCMFIGYRYLSSSSPYIAELSDGSLETIGQGIILGDKLVAGNYRTLQPTRVRLGNGNILHLSANAEFKLFNRQELTFYSGMIEVESTTGQNTLVHSDSFTLDTNGSDLAVTVDNEQFELLTGESTLIQPKRWKPKHYWPFEGASDRVIDTSGDAHGFTGPAARRIDGLVGTGAFAFDNSADARIDVGSGGGNAPGTGSFAVSDGVTIEALIRPSYTGKFGDIDEIFRKDNGDQELRMLLSFQHDRGKAYLKPEGDFAQSLSFGLYILGQGYHELKLPLDGKNGRPSLAEINNGNSYHVVATYQVNTGRKSIFINGIELASYQYIPGSKVLSGGPGTAAVGNNPAQHRWHIEAFNGVIDEVAFYDFALTPWAIKQHFSEVQKGNNYFGLSSNQDNLPENVKIPLSPNSTYVIDPVTGLPDSMKSSE